MQVRKRDGRLVEYQPEKIYKAILAAAVAADEDIDIFLMADEDEKEMTGAEFMARKIAMDICAIIDANDIDMIEVEEIQDLIENHLMLAGMKKTAKAFILYRNKRAEDRKKAERFKQIIIDRAINPADVNEKKNANLDESSFSGRMYESTEQIWKDVALSDFMPDYIEDAHRKGEIYLHDLSRWAIGQHNCTTCDMEALLKNGFVTRQVTLRPPKRFSTACQQVAVIFQIISQHQYGGIASGHIDRDLAPYVAMSREKINEQVKGFVPLADALLEDELKQGAQALIHNLASLQSRPGSQLPFSSLNLGADTSDDGRLACRAILEAMIEGVGPNHTTPPFPILCFQVKKGINRNPEDPNYDLYKLAIECAARRLTPNFVNLDSSVCHSDPDDPDTWLTSMGCRTQMGFDRFNKEHPYNRIGRGNLSPHTIIPVDLGIKYGICRGERDKPDLDGFRKEFEQRLELAEESLLIRARYIFNQKMGTAYELYANPVWKSDAKYDPNASVYEVMKHGSLVIGQLGWAETLIALFGKHHGESQEAADFLFEMVTRLNTFCKEASERNNLNYASYFTPAESCCHTVMKILQERFGEIENVTDHEYLTNSIHLPVWFDCDVLEKIDIESKYSIYGVGGNILYVEFDSTAVNNTEGVEAVINYAMDKDVPYFAFNFPLDECPNCGYAGEIPAEGCPECGTPDEDICRYRRVTGYITNDYRRAFNKGKQAETLDRVKHTKGIVTSYEDC